MWIITTAYKLYNQPDEIKKTNR